MNEAPIFIPVMPPLPSPEQLRLWQADMHWRSLVGFSPVPLSGVNPSPVSPFPPLPAPNK